MDAIERLTTLQEIEATIWRELVLATHDRHHGWRTPVLATLNADHPEARTVVLREVDDDAHRVVFFSDSRAAKIEQLRRQPLASMLCWSRQLDWQLRVRLMVSIETEGIAVTSRWARVKLSPNADDYLSALTPGAPLQRAGSTPEARERVHFAVLDAEVIAIDWLELRREGHRRAAFDAQGARWLQP